MAQLDSLRLDGTPITDAGLEHLKQLAQLRTLWLNYTHATLAGVTKLRQALPDCKIEYSRPDLDPESPFR
jgi:hypothetical protein